jgi:putative membrane-bound dehydrogenase-like protein
MKHLLTFLLVAFVSLARADETGRLEVLFLGDNGHHTPDKRFFQALPALHPRGINLTYTDKLSDLNPANLAQYDVLAIYANWEKLPPAQEKALVDFVQSGKGLAPIHCASFCFQNSAEYIRIVGAQFKSHQTGTFKTEIVKADHPILQGFTGFETWDETYVHTKQNPDCTILQKRESEPWTWVRNEGKGRVFYTAYGHDERTWSNPGFQELLYRGLVWCAGDAAAARLKAWTPKPLAYDPAPKVPNYERRTPPPQYQLPLTPEESRKRIYKPADMQLSLAASETSAVKLLNVIEMQWDERGRLWIVETVDYPNEITPGGPGNDRIRILEDTNGDGIFDKATLFADQLSGPTSMCFANGGIIVQQAPHTLFLRDSNGDGKADEKKVLITGWGPGDTHAGPSNLKLGFDGWIYGCVGYSGFNGEVGGEALRFSQAFYRFRPDGSKLEVLGKTSNNTWGFAFDEDGNIFGSTANNQPSVYEPIAKRYYDMVDGIEQPTNPGIMVNLKAPKHMERIRQVDVFDGYTAEAGHNIYTARSFPQEWWNRVALLCEPTVHILYKGVLTREGTHFRTENGWNVLGSDDEHFAPVFADVGPDGAIWVSDFYSFLIQHNPTPSDQRGGFNARTGRGNAFVSDLRDTQRARIWRLSSKGGTPSKQWKLTKDDTKSLLEALQSDNLLWRMHAQRLLVERAQQDVVPALKQLVANGKPDAAGIAGGSLHALWTLQQLGAADTETVTAALKHPAAGVRRAAASMLPRAPLSAQAILDAGLLKDAEPLVRLTALLALADQPAFDPAGAELFKLNDDPVVKADKWLPTALTIAASRHANGYLTAALNAAKPLGAAAPEEPAPKLEEVIRNGDVEGLVKAAPAEPMFWKPRTYAGTAELSVVKSGRNNSTCLKIESKDGSDTSWYQDLAVETGHDYEISGWIRTEGLKGATGALLEIHQLNGAQPKSKAITGTSDWTRVAFRISTGQQNTISLNCLYGGWGRSTGRAWWDDISVVKLGKSGTVAGAAGGTAGDAQAIARSFTRYATPTQLTMLNTLIAAKPSTLGRDVSLALKNPSKPKAAEDLRALARTHQIVELKAVEGMKYDVMSFTVKAGKPIALVFTDADQLQHNLVVVKPGAVEPCCKKADEMATQPDAVAKNYIPSLAEIIKATKLLNPGETEVLKLDALAPGEYPYLCTFPGHCHIMRGVMKVEP